MTGEKFTDDGSDFERRKFLKALGVGAGVSGVSGLGSADDTTSIVEVEPISGDRAAEEFQIARESDYYNAIAEYMTQGALEPLTDRVWGHQVYTDDEAFNARNPVMLSLPYAGPEGNQMGFLWIIQFADAEGRRRPNGGVGTSVELIDGEYYHRIYGWEDERPAILEQGAVETSPGDLSAQSWGCMVCTWVVDVICQYGWYWMGETGCGWLCWSSTCEQSCEVVVDWLDTIMCSWFSSNQICSWAGFC